MTGSITEIAGLAAAGKTQFCTTFAVNLAQHHRIGTLFVDTKGDFSGTRIRRMLEARRCPTSEMDEVMSRIHVEHVSDIYELITVLNELVDKLDSFRMTKLLVIDSMATLWFMFSGDTSREGWWISKTDLPVFSLI